MATLEKIRNMSPALLGAFAVMLVLFFVLGDLDPSSLVQQSAEYQNKVIAVIDGEEVKTAEYDQLNNLISDNMKAQQERAGTPQTTIDEKTTRNQAWNALIETKLIENIGHNAGLFINENVVADMIVNNPPEEMKNYFKDSTGNFMRDIYVKIATNPNSVVSEFNPNSQMSEEEKQKAVQQYRDFFNTFTQQYTQRRKSATTQTLLTEAGAGLSLAYVKDKYKAENSIATLNYVKFDINLVKNSEVTVSDDEIKAYYEKNKHKYATDEKRKLKYVTFPLTPSSQDSLNAKSKMADITGSMYKAFTKEEQKKVFDEKLLKYNGKSSAYTPISELPADVSKYVIDKEVGSFIGPIQVATGTKYFRYDDKRKGDSTKEVVRASHILFKTDSPDTDSVKALANKIYKKIKAGASFAEMAFQYSADGSKSSGGDLGYFGKGRMVPEFEDACFNGNIGEVVGPIKTQFGYHIIKISDKTSDEIKYSEISIKPKTSGSTERTQYASARNFYNKLSNGANIDELAEKMNLKVIETGAFDKTRPVLGSNKITHFAFNNKVGTALEPQELNVYGVIVAVVSAEEKAGFTSLEIKSPIINEILLKEKKLDYLKAKAQNVYNTLKNETSLYKAQDIDPSLNILFAPSISNNGILPSSNLREPKVTSAAFTTELNKISKPIRGDYGYYLMIVTERSVPDEETINKNIQQFYASELNKIKRSVYYDWFETIRKNSEIVDKRFDVYDKY